MRFGKVIIIFAIGLVLVVMVWPLFTNPREEQSRQRIEFVQMGKKIMHCIESQPDDIPSTLEELELRGALSAEDLQFAEARHVQYHAPLKVKLEDHVLLTMPMNKSVVYHFHLDGGVTKADSVVPSNAAASTDE